MKKVLLVGASAVLAGVLSGCGSSIPSCDSKDVTGVLTDIIRGQLADEYIVRKDDENFDHTYSSFMTESTDEKAKKVTCKAKFTMTDRRNKGVVRDDFIHYTARYTDNKDEVYVELLPY